MVHIVVRIEEEDLLKKVGSTEHAVISGELICIHLPTQNASHSVYTWQKYGIELLVFPVGKEPKHLQRASDPTSNSQREPSDQSSSRAAIKFINR